MGGYGPDAHNKVVTVLVTLDSRDEIVQAWLSALGSSPFHSSRNSPAIGNIKGKIPSSGTGRK